MGTPQLPDKFCSSFTAGDPMLVAGPACQVGLDVAYHVATDLGAAFGSRFGGADIGVLKEMVDAGYLGMWRGEGRGSEEGG